jgi:toxin ParE1/3/4
MRVTWHRRARQDLRHIRAQIAAENPQAAQRVAQRLLRAVDLLAEQPGMGRVGRVPNTREFVITDTPYIAAYQIVEDTLVILRVLHGAQRWPEQF